MVDNRDKSRAFALGSSLGHLLHRAQQVAADHFSAQVSDPKLTLRQFALLAAVGEQGGRSQTTLVRITGIDRSTLADMIRRLEERGLVERRNKEDDRRANSVSLTLAGERKLAAATPAAMAADEALIAMLPKGRRQAFSDALAALAAKAEAASPLDDGEPTQKKRAKEAPKPQKAAKPVKAAKPKKAGKAEKARSKAKAARPVSEAPAARAVKSGKGKAKAKDARKDLERPSDKKRKKKL